MTRQPAYTSWIHPVVHFCSLVLVGIGCAAQEPTPRTPQNPSAGQAPAADQLSIVSEEDRTATTGWISLFNGHDLSGWINVNGAPETWGVKDGVITCTGHPIAALRRPTMYENFILEFEWRHLKPEGNAGCFIWASPVAAVGQPFLQAIEIQVLDNDFNIPGKNEWYTTHGDVFPIHGSEMTPIHRRKGSRCFPIEERSKSSPQWNHYRVEAKDGKVRLAVNGKIVSGGDLCRWKKGYLGLESEGSPTEWRNIRLKELPSAGAVGGETAPEAKDWRPMFTGIDFRDWEPTSEANATTVAGWKAHDWFMTREKTPAEAAAAPLSRSLGAGAWQLMLDIEDSTESAVSLAIVNEQGGEVPLPRLASGPKKWHRLYIQRDSSGLSLSQGTYQPEGPTTKVSGLEASLETSLRLKVTAPPASRLANFYLRSL